MLRILRPSLPLSSAARVIPISKISPESIRLPPKPSVKKEDLKQTSPTIDRLARSLGKGRLAGRALGAGVQDGRGLGAIPVNEVGVGKEEDVLRVESSEAETVATEGESDLPPNLRFEEFVPRRNEYRGVKATHRQLLQRLRREG
ncbi:hypothetical protein T439DRAFT_328544 [Meredithblackwellia eburnea MCA 4105]